MSKQLALALPIRGGERKGAGRKPKGKTALVSHAARPRFARITPALVTLKVGAGLPSLRSSRRFAVIREAFRAARGAHGMRVVEFSVLGEHLHLIVESDSSACLSRGMQGLCVRLARALNRLLLRTGALFADHYHSRLLRSPTELTMAIRYVLTNAEHHFGDRGVDWFSSAAADHIAICAEPMGWLLRSGWRLGTWPRQCPPPGTRYGSSRCRGEEAHREPAPSPPQAAAKRRDATLRPPPSAR